jgi:hypothetical protein
MINELKKIILPLKKQLQSKSFDKIIILPLQFIINKYIYNDFYYIFLAFFFNFLFNN